MMKGNVYVVIDGDEKKVFTEFDDATKYNDEHPNTTLYKLRVDREIRKYERTVHKVDRIPKGGIKFTNEEYEYIKKSITNKPLWVILNKIDYHGRNYIYVYEKAPTYSCAILELFKYENCYTLEGNIKFNTIEEFIEYTK